MADKKRFYLYTEYESFTDDMTDEEAGKLFKAILHHENGGEVTDIPAEIKSAWAFIRKRLDNNAAAYEERCEANRKVATNRHESSRIVTNGTNRNESSRIVTNGTNRNENALDNDNDKDDDKGTEEDNESPTETKEKTERDKISLVEKQQITEVIDYLNERCGTKYRPTTAETIKHIRGRLKDGNTVEDLKTVIDKKANDWLGTEWEKYLRPGTLFIPANFENYLNQPDHRKQERGGIDAFLGEGADDG